MLPFASYGILSGIQINPPCSLIKIIYYLYSIANQKRVFASRFGKKGSVFLHCGKWRLDSENDYSFLVVGSGIFCGKMVKFALEFKKSPILI